MVGSRSGRRRAVRELHLRELELPTVRKGSEVVPASSGFRLGGDALAQKLAVVNPPVARSEASKGGACALSACSGLPLETRKSLES